LLLDPKRILGAAGGGDGWLWVLQPLNVLGCKVNSKLNGATTNSVGLVVL